MGSLVAKARELYALGYMPLPIERDKRPCVRWKDYTTERAPESMVYDWFGRDIDGIGVVCGAASGQLEMLELEGRAVNEIGLEQLAQAMADNGAGEVWQRLTAGWVERSPSGGIHWHLRVDGQALGNTRLASRPSAPGAPGQVLIETRGQGGFTVVAPSGGRAHPTGGAWTPIAGGPSTVPTLTTDERDLVYGVCSLFDAAPVKPVEMVPVDVSREGALPGDDFNTRATWDEILAPEGWQVHHSDGHTTYWTRPGKSIAEGSSATTGHSTDGADRLYVFSTSTAFDANRPYSKFAAFALLHHGGDYASAARDLASRGYGKRTDTPGTLTPVPALPDEGQPDRTVELTPATAFRVRRVRWLWEGRIPMGTLAVVAGRAGLGKSTTTYWLAAQVTRGTLPGEYHGTPRSVFVCATEDSWEHTIVPRLIAAGADLARVFRVDVVEGGYHAGLSLPRDVHALANAARSKDAALLVLDPLMSRIDGKLDSHKDADVRRALEPLVDLADQVGMTIVGIMHNRKGGGTDPLEMVMGSTAFNAVARSVHSVIPDPDDDTGKRKLFATAKNNLGRDDLPVLAFTVESASIPTDDGDICETGRIEWQGEISGSLRDVMEAGADTDRTATAEAAEWLYGLLAANGGSMPRRDVLAAARTECYSEATLKRAAKRAHVTPRRVSGYQGGSVWTLEGGAGVSFGSSPLPPGETGLNGLNELNGVDKGKRGDPGGLNGHSVHSVHSDQPPRARDESNPTGPVGPVGPQSSPTPGHGPTASTAPIGDADGDADDEPQLPLDPPPMRPEPIPREPLAFDDPDRCPTCAESLSKTFGRSPRCRDKHAFKRKNAA